MKGKVQGLSQLKYAMGNSTEMLFYWKRCMEVSKQLVQNSSEGKHSILKEGGKKMVSF